MVAIDAAKVAIQTGFKRTNPKTDLFKVCQTSKICVLSHMDLRKHHNANGEVEVALDTERTFRSLQVVKFHHIDWWCADATSTHKRYCPRSTRSQADVP